MPVLQYDFAVVGLGVVNKALSSIERRFVEHNRRVSQTLGTRVGGRQTVGGATRTRLGADNSLRGLDQIGKVAAREEMKRHQLRMRNIQKEKDAHANAFRDIGRVAAREEAKRMRHEQRAVMVQGRGRAAARERFARSTMGVAGRSVAGSVRAVGAVGAGALAIGGGAAVASSLQSEIEIDKRVRQAIINARGAGEKGAFSPEQLRSRVRSAAIAGARPEEEVMGGVEAFVAKTGDIKGAVANLQMFSTVAAATGANVEDIASAAADLATKFDLADPKEMANALAAFAFQGKKGAFELRAMAELMPRMGAAGARFGMKGAKGARELGGMAQIAMTAAGSPEGAATAVEATLRQLVAKAGEIQSGKALGGKRVNVFEGGDPTKAARNARDVIGDVISASGGNLVQLQKVFGDEGIKAISPLVTKFREAADKVGPKGSDADRTAAGRKAVEDAFSSAIDAVGDYSDIQKDAADATAGTSAQIERAQIKFREAIATNLLPALTKLMPSFEKLIPVAAKGAELLGKFIDELASKPITTIGKLIAAKLVFDLGAAGIGAAVKAALTRLLTGGGIPPTGGGGGPAGKTTVGGVLGATQTGLGLGTLAAAGITAYGVGAFEGSEAEATKGLKSLQYQKTGGDVASAEAALAQEKKRLASMQEPTERLKTVEKIGLATGGIGALPFYALRKLVAEPATQSAVNTQKGTVTDFETLVATLKAGGDSAAKSLQEGASAAKKTLESAQPGGGTGQPNRGTSPTEPRR